MVGAKGSKNVCFNNRLKPSFNKTGDVVLPKSKTSHVRISYPPNVRQK